LSGDEIATSLFEIVSRKSRPQTPNTLDRPWRSFSEGFQVLPREDAMARWRSFSPFRIHPNTPEIQKFLCEVPGFVGSKFFVDNARTWTKQASQGQLALFSGAP